MSISLGAREYLIKCKSPSVPYDAEIMYLESTGTQYIDTVIGVASGQIAMMRFMFTTEPSGTSTPTEYVFGTNVSRNTFFHIGRRYVSGDSSVSFTLASYSSHYVPQGDCSWHDAILDSTLPNRHVVFDSVETADSSVTVPSTASHLLLFARSTTAGVAQNIAHARVSSCSIRDTSTNQLLIDLIPVRKNGVGYMYDRVSGQLLGNSGTDNFVLGPDKPYDYEVAYIERDCGKNWIENGIAVQGGFNLNKYLDDSSMTTATRPMEARWSSDPIDGGGIFWALGMTWNAFFTGAFLGRSSNPARNRYRYSSWYDYTGPDMDIDTFHVQKSVPDGQGTWAYYFDGENVGSSIPSASTTTYINMLAMRVSSTNLFQGLRMRVANVRLGSDVYLIPVVKGNAVGFYNMVDGHLFLEEQACLSAGPVV